MKIVPRNEELVAPLVAIGYSKIYLFRNIAQNLN